MTFKPIDRWSSNQALHLRNIHIALSCARQNSYVQSAKDYNVSCNRIMQIYRLLMAKLCEREFGVEYLKAYHDKNYYNHPQRITILEKYLVNYLCWQVESQTRI